MLGRFSAPLRRRQAMMSRRSLATNPWLSDKSLYPMLAICGAAVLFAAWFAPMHLYKKPETQAPIRRRSTVIAHKKPGEHTPISEDMYKKSSEVTKGIYRVTIKDKEGSDLGKKPDEMGKRTESK